MSRPATPGRPRRRPRLRWLALVLLLLLSPAVYSYTRMAIAPSSLPLGVRSVEWLRQHHGNWLVDEGEHVYYGWWKAPKKGGAALKALPQVGLPAAMARRTASAVLERKESAKGLKDRERGERTELAIKAVKQAPWPPPVKPVFRKALPGEGVWHATGPSVQGAPPVLVTTFRSERDYPRVVAYVAWFDHKRTAVAFYPGRYEPPRAAVRGPMSVPLDQRWRLLATFNAGFIYTDGLNGSTDDGRVNEPLHDGLATLVGYRDGRVAIVVWHGGDNAGPQIAWTRQSLPPIVWGGRLNPNLNDGPQWGFTLGNAIRVWRTGVGVDSRGNLIYAAADYQTVSSLALILRRSGAVRAMQFDINPEWPSLITYAHRGGLDPVKVVPNVQQSASRYLVPDDRDFFAVYRRLKGPVTVPFR